MGNAYQMEIVIDWGHVTNSTRNALDILKRDYLHIAVMNRKWMWKRIVDTNVKQVVIVVDLEHVHQIDTVMDLLDVFNYDYVRSWHHPIWSSCWLI